MANVVLVHGAWCDGSSWAKVIGPLQQQGHHVVAVQNPLTSLADDVAWTRRIIAEQDGPVALVGHSYGGAVISGASADNPQVAGLVFVAAYAPDEGETVLALGERFDPTPGGASIRATSDGWLTLDPGMFPSVFAGDIDPADAAVLAAVQKPTHGACFASPAGPAGWHSLPTAYIRSTDDEMVNPTLQSWLAERAAATVTDLASSHASPVSHGSEVAEVILGVLG
jgi:pimeloyl-ACP methyl ester carboxylesterase